MKHIFSRLCYSSRIAYICHVPVRNILSSAYRCDIQWDHRLMHESFKSVTARDLGLSILHTIDAGGIISPLDYDIFANKVHELDAISTEFIEKIIRKYAETQSAVQIIDSTSHAITRTFIGFRWHDKLLELLRQRAHTGLFLDEVSANLLLDEYIDTQNWSKAIQVVWELCLQDHFSFATSISPVTLALALHASLQLIQNGAFEEIPSDNLQNDDSQEVEYKFVRFVRNPNYDNFFDVTRPRLMLGFVLLHISELFSSRPDAIRLSSPTLVTLLSTLAQGLRLFGYAYSEQLTKSTDSLKKIQTIEHIQQAGLSSDVLEKLISSIESCETRSDDSVPGRGEPVLPSESEVQLALEQLNRLRELAAAVTSNDLFSRIESFIHKEVLENQDCMLSETMVVELLYRKFEDDRHRIWTEQVNSARKKAILETTKKSLRDLLDEEERLTSFKNSEAILHHAWLAPRSRAERRWSRMKEWKQDITKQREKSEQHLNDT